MGDEGRLVETVQGREGMDKHYQEGGRDAHLVFGLETCNCYC